MKLEDFCYVNPTEQLKKNEQYDFVEMADIVPGNRYVFSKTKKIFNGSFSKFSNKDTLMAKITPCLENGKISQFIGANKGFGSTEFNVFREKYSVSDANYLYYLISSSIVKEPAIKSMTGACGRQRVNIDEIKQIEVPDFSIYIQQKIAKVLSNYDDLIENNNKRIKILEEMAQKIYKEWFVNFKFPGHETATFKQTDLGKIPSDWGLNKLSDFGETITGKTPSKNDDSNYGNEVDFIKTPDMHNGIFCLDTVEHLSLKGANTQKNKLLPIGSICVSCIGTVGVVAITTKNSQTNQQINSIIPKNSFYREYLYFVCNNLKPTLENLGANGATMTNVNKNKFDNIQVSKPSDKLLQAFSQLIKPIFEQIKNLSLKNQTLKQTRELLLPRLISGEIDVENMDIE